MALSKLKTERLLICARRALALLDPDWQAAWDLKVVLMGCQIPAKQWVIDAPSPILLDKPVD